jgi:hypothetical protein
VGVFIQLFKDFFLIITTTYIIFWFLIDYQKAILYYLFFYAITSFLGFNRVLYFENLIIPIMIWIGISIKDSRFAKPNTFYFLFFIHMILITYINNLAIIESHSNGVYLFVILLIYSNYIFKDSDNVMNIVFLVWVITLGIALNSIMYGGNLFSIANINSEERELILDNGIVGSSAAESGIDLNYFGIGQAVGAIITLMFIYYRKSLLSTISFSPLIKNVISNSYFSLILYLVLGLEVWLVVRGLSRGALLALLSGGIVFLLILRKFKYLIYGGIILIALYFIMDSIGIVSLYTERILRDESGTSGRNFIWLAMIGSAYSQGGILQIIFGGGIDWPWWEFWSGSFWDKGVIPSSHNQWLTLFVNFGILGICLFFIPIIIGLRNNLKNNNSINNIRIVIFMTIFIACMSLEPLIFTPYVWFLVPLVTTFTSNIKDI